MTVANLSCGTSATNTFNYYVQAENETVRTYTIKVNREDDRSSNSDLSSITLSSGNINFSKDVTDYSLSVPYSVTKIDVVATPEDSKSKVNVVSPDLVVGTNTILITVTSETGVSKIYKNLVNDYIYDENLLLEGLNEIYKKLNK